jgi:hypothetical protein
MRLTSASLKARSARGCASVTIATRAPASPIASIVWRNSAWVAPLFERKWTSSIASRSRRRTFARKASIEPERTAWM